jgi:hypothetical protein
MIQNRQICILFEVNISSIGRFDVQVGLFEGQVGKIEAQVGIFDSQVGKIEVQVGIRS